MQGIRILENEQICEQVRQLGPLFESTMKSLMQFDILGDVRGSHFMMALEFVKDRETKQSFDDDIAVGMRVAQQAQARGLIVRPLGSMIVLSPPLILSKARSVRLAQRSSFISGCAYPN